jgi:hypothetical protein
VEEITEGQRKALENRMRRVAERQGLTLTKSRRRDPRAIGYGTYTLTDGVIVIGERLSITQVGQLLHEDPTAGPSKERHATYY